MSNQQISVDQIRDLRERGILKEDEIAFISGDLIIAEHVLTSEKRVLGGHCMLSESSKRLLKG